MRKYNFLTRTKLFSYQLDMAKTLQPHQQAAEYLCDFIDKVLEAFRTGTGILNNAVEPITHDVARRLIWREVHRSFEAFGVDPQTDSFVTDAVLWLRVDAPRPEQLLTALVAVEGMGMECRVRFYGNRQVSAPTATPGRGPAPTTASSPALAYVLVAREQQLNMQATHEILTELQKRGCSVRDWTLGAFPLPM